jgi:RNA binding exosome subunit
MSIELQLRYQKPDPYGNEIFIVSNKYDNEKESYEKLKKLEAKLQEMNVGSFLPVYHNSELGYCTIRFKFYKGQKLVERNIYSIKFVVKKSERDDSVYINCFVNNIKMYKKAEPQNVGEILDLGCLI